MKEVVPRMGRLALLLCPPALTATRGLASPYIWRSSARSVDATGSELCTRRFVSTFQDEPFADENADQFRVETLAPCGGTTQRRMSVPAPSSGLQNCGGNTQ